METNIGAIVTNPKKKFLPSTLHTKYVDDLTLLESFNLQEVLVPNMDRQLPDNFHARLGQKLLLEKSQVYDQIAKIETYAERNEMKINSDRTNFILFNPIEKFDFIPEYEIRGKCIETEEEIKILGLILRV